jgi:hypothetical protein
MVPNLPKNCTEIMQLVIYNDSLVNIFLLINAQLFTAVMITSCIQCVDSVSRQLYDISEMKSDVCIS